MSKTNRYEPHRALTTRVDNSDLYNRSAEQREMEREVEEYLLAREIERDFFESQENEDGRD